MENPTNYILRKYPTVDAFMSLLSPVHLGNHLLESLTENPNSFLLDNVPTNVGLLVLSSQT